LLSGLAPHFPALEQCFEPALKTHVSGAAGECDLAFLAVFYLATCFLAKAIVDGDTELVCFIFLMHASNFTLSVLELK